MLKWMPSRYTIRQCACRERSRHASNCCVRVWLSRLMVLATSSNSHQRLGHFSHLMGTCPGHEHLRQSFGNVRFSMVAHFVKTQKPSEIRATLLLFRCYVFSMDFVSAL